MFMTLTGPAGHCAETFCTQPTARQGPRSAGVAALRPCRPKRDGLDTEDQLIRIRDNGCTQRVRVSPPLTEPVIIDRGASRESLAVRPRTAHRV